MTNYLFLRGNRNKRFFIDIASELSDKGHNCYQLKFELGELFFKGEIHSIFAPFHISNKQYPITNETLLNMQIYNLTYQTKIKKKKIKDKELILYKRYMYLIDNYIKKNDIDVVCLFNGYHWIDQVVRFIAVKRGLKLYYFEDGLFRPYTITCDPKGINANSSVPRSPYYYDSLKIDNQKFKKYLFNPENPKLENKANENLFLISSVKGVSMLGNLLKISPKIYAHITIWQAIKYFFFKLAYKYRQPNKLELPEDYIFLPFQVSRDSQIFYNSPNIENMEQLLDIVLHAVTLVNQREGRNLKIIIKEHPEDMSRNNYKHLKNKYYSHPSIIFIRKFNIKKIIKHASAIITINSTVGIEALAQHKKVITLGNALYNIEGITTYCKDPSNLSETLQTVLNSRLNIGRIDKFLYYLRFHYQVEGTINAPSKITASNIANRISHEEDILIENRAEVYSI